MYPPVTATMLASSGVTEALGSSPVRVYPAGKAPEGGAVPYAVHQLITGAPENYLGSLPDVDQYTLQFDVYSTTAGDVRRVARVLRDALEPVAHIVRWGGEERDDETGMFRYSFDVDWFVKR